MTRLELGCRTPSEFRSVSKLEDRIVPGPVRPLKVDSQKLSPAVEGVGLVVKQLGKGLSNVLVSSIEGPSGKWTTWDLRAASTKERRRNGAPGK